MLLLEINDYNSIIVDVDPELRGVIKVTKRSLSLHAYININQFFTFINTICFGLAPLQLINMFKLLLTTMYIYKF